MKQLLLSLAFLSLTGLGFAQEKGISFERGKSWEQIKAKAKAENKYIFMDVFATWCGSCKDMEKNVYPSQVVGSFMNEKFISVKVQADHSKEDNEEVMAWYQDAKRILEDCHIDGYPSYLFFSPEGKLVTRGLGYKDVNALVTLASEAIDPQKQYCTQLEQFKQGKLELKRMPDLARKAKSFGEIELAQQIANRYVNGYLLKLPKQELFTKENLNLIGSFLDNENSKAFELFMKEQEKINAVLGDNQAEKMVLLFIDKKYLPHGDLKKIKKADWDDLYKMVVSKFGILGEEQICAQRMMYYLINEDWRNYGLWYQKYLERGLKRGVYNINFLSWRLFEHVNDPEILEFACGVMKYVIETWDQNSVESFDTYANLLYKVGKKTQAVEWEERAVKLSNDKNEFVETLDKMKQGLPTWQEISTNP